MTDRAQQILDFSEAEIRKGGVDAVSYRQIAAAIGIKSASVHYHFPTKADLTREVVARYADRFLDGLGAADHPKRSPSEQMERLGDAYLSAYRNDSATCLCAVLGAVAHNLPEETLRQVKGFYGRLTAWIETATAGADARFPPGLIISTLQGALILAVATEDAAPLAEAKRHIVSAFES